MTITSHAAPYRLAADNAVETYKGAGGALMTALTQLFVAQAASMPGNDAKAVSKVISAAMPEGVKLATFKSYRSMLVHRLDDTTLAAVRAKFGDYAALSPDAFEAIVGPVSASLGDIRAIYDAHLEAEKQRKADEKAAKAIPLEVEGTLAEPTEPMNPTLAAFTAANVAIAALKALGAFDELEAVSANAIAAMEALTTPVEGVETLAA
jgi:hypothetical protein